jgi:hypothetical protein
MICTRRLETRDKISQLEKSHAGSLGTDNKDLDFLGTDKERIENRREDRASSKSRDMVKEAGCE